MKLTLQMPDEIYEAYGAHVEALNGKVSIEEAMIAQLARFKEVRAAERIVVVHSRPREALEAILAGGQLKDDQDLLGKVQKLADIKIGEIRINFTPGELAQIRRYADRNRRPVQDVMQTTANQMKPLFLEYVG